MIINEKHSEVEGSDFTGKSSVPLPPQPSPLPDAIMEGIDDDGDAAASLPHSGLQATLEGIDDDTEAVGSLFLSSPVLSKKPVPFDLSSSSSSPQSSPMSNGQLSAVATAYNSSTTWKNSFSIDVAYVTRGPKPRANQSCSYEDEDNRETSEAIIEFL